jgi:hypothetical protein
MVDGIVVERPEIKRRIVSDLTGRRVGKLVVVKPDTVRGKFKWICQCDCGNVKSIYENCLKRGETKSCGCIKIERFRALGHKRFKDLTGRKFGKLMTMELLSGRRWRCRCDCGNDRIVPAKSLHDGSAVDCQSHKNGNRCSLGRAA